jgi:FkbM family methyltransferase
LASATAAARASSIAAEPLVMNGTMPLIMTFSLPALTTASTTFQVLRANTLEIPKCQIEQFAVSNFEGTSNLYFDSPLDPLSSLTNRNLSWTSTKYSKQEIQVPVTTLDSYISTKSLVPDLLKIDTEGHDLNVLLGCEKYIPRISVVVFEFGGENKDTKTFFLDFYDFFTRFRFTLFRVTPYGTLRVCSYKEIHENFQCTNYIAVNPNLMLSSKNRFWV